MDMDGSEGNLQEGLRPVHVWIAQRRGGIGHRLMRGAPVGVLEGYGARRLGGRGGGGGSSPATGHPVRDHERRARGRARRRAMAPVRGATPPLVGHG